MLSLLSVLIFDNKGADSVKGLCHKAGQLWRKVFENDAKELW